MVGSPIIQSILCHGLVLVEGEAADAAYHTCQQPMFGIARRTASTCSACCGSPNWNLKPVLVWQRRVSAWRTGASVHLPRGTACDRVASMNLDLSGFRKRVAEVNNGLHTSNLVPLVICGDEHLGWLKAS